MFISCIGPKTPSSEIWSKTDNGVYKSSVVKPLDSGHNEILVDPKEMMQMLYLADIFKSNASLYYIKS